MSYRVDNLPIPLRWFLLAYSYALASFLYAMNRFLFHTCRLEYVGREHLAPDKAYIYCLWHDGLGPYFVSFLCRERPHAWLSHPLWYMKPIHLLTSWMGVKKTVLGSAGNQGRVAAEEIVHCLKEGFSTMVTPDGPAGPAHHLKTGVLHISKASGVPIVPFRVVTRCHLRLPFTWDGKRFPLPFSKVRFEFSEPRVVTEENFSELQEWLPRALG